MVMPQGLFEQIIENQIARSTEMLMSKNAGYSGGGDKISSFRKAAALRKTTMHDVLGGMMLKHTVSIFDMLDDDIEDHSSEVWDEKITDHINYLLLLQAVLHDQRSELSDLSVETMSREESLIGPAVNTTLIHHESRIN